MKYSRHFKEVMKYNVKYIIKFVPIKYGLFYRHTKMIPAIVKVEWNYTYYRNLELHDSKLQYSSNRYEYLQMKETIVVKHKCEEKIKELLKNYKSNYKDSRLISDYIDF